MDEDCSCSSRSHNADRQLQADYEILKGIDFPWPINDTVLQHHERLDDSCYPQAVDACLRLFREQDYHFA
ncbi:MAG: hypothetical protein WC298_10040 [Sideroxydans sp.]